MVDVSSQNNSISINVSSSGNSASINATPDMAMFYSEKSREWAISNRMVDGVDYSSKYYANKANENALNAKSFAQLAQNTYDQFNNSIDSSLSDINNSVESAITTINTKNDEVIDSINNTKTAILQDIEFVADGEKEEIRDLANDIKEGAEDIINRVSLSMFDTILKDHVLTYEESKGLALQGTWVYKSALAGERYGYADFYAKCLEEYQEATAVETVNGVTVRVHSNGHKFFDIADKEAIDNFFNTMGTAWFYGVDTENERVFLPRNNFFDQATADGSEVGQSIEAGLPNITAILTPSGRNLPSNYTLSGAFYGESMGGRQLQQTDGSYTGFDLRFDASRSNPIYGNSDTVQPPAVKKLLYICVGNTVSDTSWVDVVTQVKGGVKDLEDKTQEGLNKLNTTTNNSIADINTTAKSHSVLTYKNITNCLLEVPQRIKYELADGTLTLKAGSVVIVPYGTEDLTSQYPKGATFIHENFKVYDTQFEDGKFFVWAEVQSDISASDTSTNTSTIAVTVCVNVNIIYLGRGGNSSGTGNTTANNYGIYYNTDTNKVNHSDNTATVLTDNTHSLPILTTKGDGTNAYASIDQIFNGMGYIGSTVWVDKGVKGLKTNGKNPDGTYINEEFTLDGIRLNNSFNANYDYYAIIYGESNRLGRSQKKATTYDAQNNYIYREDGQFKIGCMVADLTATTSGVTTFRAKQPYQSADYNQIDGRWVGKELQITSSMSSATYDLSSYLPNDGYDYEVMIAVCTYAGSDGNESYFAVYSDIIPRTLAWLNCWGNNASRQNADVFALPVSASRKIYTYAVSMASGQVFAIGYRRLGMNM